MAKRPSRRTRKTIRMIVDVSVPIATSAAAARLEVRTLIGEQRNYYLDYDEVKVKAVRPAPRPAQ